jgi:hypothetical protein
MRATSMERPAAPEPAPANRETRLAFVASEPAPAGREPRHSLPSGDRLRLVADEGRHRGPSAGPLPSRPAIPSADRLRLAADEGSS